MKAALLFAIFAVAISFPLSVAAENESTVIASSASQSEGITSDDWEELQSEAQAELSAQNSKESNSASETGKNEEAKGGSFKDFKEGSYVGSGEWLLFIGIILVVLGVAGIGFIIFMMIRRKKLSDAMSSKKVTASAKRERTSSIPAEITNSLFEESDEAVHPYYGRKPSGRRIAPKSNKETAD